MYAIISLCVLSNPIFFNASSISISGLEYRRLKASGFIQKKSGEHKKSKIIPDPIVKLPIADDIILPESKEEKLSEIIREINEKTGKNFDTEVAKRAAIQVRDMMKKNEDLRKSAQNNSQKDFSFSYYDHINAALMEGMEENKEFFSYLLRDESVKKQVLGVFIEEIYKSLRQ